LPDRAATFATLMTARIRPYASSLLVPPIHRARRADARSMCSRAALNMVDTAPW
jgi:hypothetical protein